MYLLDTNVVSELRKKRPHGAVVKWITAARESDLFISVVTIAEIQAGIELTREQDRAKASELELWLDQIAASYNVLIMDATVFRYWAKIMHHETNTVSEDAMIAATAIVHKLTVVTRNVRDFKRFEVTVFNPFSAD